MDHPPSHSQILKRHVGRIGALSHELVVELRAGGRGRAPLRRARRLLSTMTLRHKTSRRGVGVHEGCDDAFKKNLAHLLHNGLVIGVEVAGGQSTHTLENHLVVVGGEREVEHEERQHARRTVWERGGEEV